MEKVFFISLTSILILSLYCRADFPVNSYPTNEQSLAGIAIDENENFIIVWNSYGQDGDSGGIFGQRFTSENEPNGNEFQINNINIAGNQKAASVAMDDKGDFVVSWHGPGIDNEDIFARMFNADGTAKGDEFQVNTETYSTQRFPQIAMNNKGDFVVVWESEQTGGTPIEAWWIFYRLYDCDGTPIGAEQKVNLLSQCRYPDTAIDDNGNFTVTWMQDDSYHSYNIVMARQYSADGSAKDVPFEVSSVKFTTITHPSIAMSGNGHFAISWHCHPENASEDDIYARRYHSDGSPYENEFIVNTTMPRAQQYPKTAMNNKKEFVIVWNSETENEREIFGQRYDEFGKTMGKEFQINTYLVNDQKYPDVAIKENGDFVTVWQSYGQDGSEYGIFGKTGPEISCPDFNNDIVVNFYDFCVLANEWLKENQPTETDLIDDNKIDEQDLNAFSNQWLKPCYQCGEVDLNKDDKIDFKDYAIWANDYSEQGPLESDITKEGRVDLTDLKALLFYWMSNY